MPQLIITGATGYIGRRLATQACESGWTVTALSRRAQPWMRALGVQHAEFRLGQASVPLALQSGAVVVHLAAETGDGVASVDAEVEVLAAQELYRLVRAAEGRFIFASSQAAKPDAPSRYGQVKWRIEQFLLKHEGIVVRPGMVYGGDDAGLFGRLCASVRRLPVIPDIQPRPRVQPIHVDDLVEGFLAIASAPDLTLREFNLAAPQPIAFADFLQAIARWRLRRRRPKLPVWVWPLLKLEPLLARFGYGVQRLRSLLELPRLDSAPSLSALGLRLRPLAAGMRDQTWDEARARRHDSVRLQHYVCGSPPPLSLARRYADAAKALGFFGAVVAPGESARSLRLRDVQGDAELRRRVDVAFALAEAHPRTAAAFYQASAQPLWRVCMELIGVVGVEFVYLVAGKLSARRERRDLP